MVDLLINLGLALTPFMFWRGMDLRTPKEILALGLALSIGLLSLYSGSLKKFKNGWLLLFVGFYLVSMVYTPNFKDFILAYLYDRKFNFLALRPLSGMWNYKPFLYAIIYLLMTISVSSIHFFKIEKIRIMKIMAACGFLMSLYIFIQAIGLDQFFKIIPEKINPDIDSLTKPTIAGFIGQPTVVSPFLVMLIPIAFYLKKYIWVACMIIAVCLTQSKVAIAAMTIGSVGYLILSNKGYLKISGALLIVTMLISGMYFHQANPGRNWPSWIAGESNGRVEAWQETWKDFTSPVNGKVSCLTGMGPGAFYYTHSIRYKTRFWQAHNDPLEALYNFGFGGIFLLFLAIKSMVKQGWQSYRRGNEYVFALMMSLLFVFLCSLGTFPFQIAPIMFYSVVIIGLLHNESILGGENAQT